MNFLKPIYFLAALFLMFSCKKEDISNNSNAPQIVLDDYSFIKVHQESSVDMQGHVTYLTITSNPFTISLPTIKKNSEIIFEGDSLSPFKYSQPDTTYWLYTPGGNYTPSPYVGSDLEYFPLNDSIHYSSWYGGSHTSSNTDNYYGKKIN